MKNETLSKLSKWAEENGLDKSISIAPYRISLPMIKVSDSTDDFSECDIELKDDDELEYQIYIQDQGRSTDTIMGDGIEVNVKVNDAVWIKKDGKVYTVFYTNMEKGIQPFINWLDTFCCVQDIVLTPFPKLIINDFEHLASKYDLFDKLNAAKTIDYNFESYTEFADVVSFFSNSKEGDGFYIYKVDTKMHILSVFNDGLNDLGQPVFILTTEDDIDLDLTCLVPNVKKLLDTLRYIGEYLEDDPENGRYAKELLDCV